MLKRILKKTPLAFLLKGDKQNLPIPQHNVETIEEQERILADWNNNGRPLPPPQIYKRRVIKEYAKEHGINMFVETGTYLGETLNFFKDYFKKLVSIELDLQLYANAKSNFSKNKNVKIYQGDSGEVLKKIMPGIIEPCLFWLDGHYSEGITAKGKLNTPIIQELDNIYNHNISDHVLLIDDARCFTGQDDYPTIEFLQEYVQKKNILLKFSVKDDIIRIHK